MSLDANLKQQIRSRVEERMEKVWGIQQQSLEKVSGYLTHVIGRQYQVLNRFAAKQSSLRQKKKQVRHHFKEWLQEKITEVSDHAPLPLERNSVMLKEFVDSSFESLDRIEEVFEEKVIQAMRTVLHKNKEMIDVTIHKTSSALESYHNNMNTQVKDHLATQFPLTEDEHFAVARDITNLVVKKTL